MMATAVESPTTATAVQELSAAVSSPPEKYLLKDGIGTDFPVLVVPAIDLTLLTASSPHAEKELQKLKLAFSSCGYIQVVNHGMDDAFLDEVHAVTKEFFSLPMEDKIKCARPKDDIDGYGNDTVYSDNQTLDWNDRLYLNVKPDSSRKLKVWPQNPKSFRKVVLEFTGKLEKLNEEILRAMAKSLKVEEECFVKQMGENPTVLSRFNLYPPCPRPESVLAAKAHGDASAMTYLLQDNKVEGLQTLMKDGHWYRVPIIHNAILVNTGDQLEIMSNGIFQSPIHRVVTNPDKERITIAIFFGPDPNSQIGPHKELIDEKRPKLFNTVVDYTSNYFQSFQTEKRPIDLLRL